MAFCIKPIADLCKTMIEIFDHFQFGPGRICFVKPNLCGRHRVRPGENTSISAMDALIAALREFGTEKILIGHGALLGTSTTGEGFQQLLEASGFIKYQKDGVEMVDLDCVEKTRVGSGEMEFHLPLNLLKDEVDSFINLGKIKTHMQTGVSLSLKNLMGLTSPEDRVIMHKGGLNEPIANLSLILKPNLNILEGIPSMEGDGPHHGKPREIPFIVAGDDMVEIDSLMCLLLGYDPSAIGHIGHAANIGSGKLCSDKQIETWAKFKVDDFKKARSTFTFGNRIFVYPTNACSNCIMILDDVRRELKAHPLRHWKILRKAFCGREQIHVIIGQAGECLKQHIREGKVVCVGACSNEFAKKHGGVCFDGCPASPEDAKKFMIEKLSE